MIWTVEHFFIYLLDIHVLLRNGYSGLLSFLKSGYLFFCYQTILIPYAFYIFGF
jgi:hypothetical protein